MFVNLHNHSYYSLLDGLAKPEDIIIKAKEQGSPGIALTDHGVMYGVVEFYKAGKTHGVNPIIGCEVYLTPFSRFSKNATVDTKRYHLVLLAKNNNGYKNLMQLVTKAHLEGMYYKPRIDWELLGQYGKDLVALTACLGGEIPQAIIAGKKEEEVLEIIKKYQQVFGAENFFLELQPHFTFPEEKIVNDVLISIAQQKNIPLVATGDSHYINKEDNIAQDILLCMQTDKKIDDIGRMSMMQEDYSIRSPEEMATIFQDTPSAIHNTLRINEMCHVELSLGKNLMPSFPLPPEKTPQQYLRDLCFQGMQKRYAMDITAEQVALLAEPPGNVLGDRNIGDILPEELRESLIANYCPEKNNIISSLSRSCQEHIERLEYELLVINAMHFDTYFLIVQDVIQWAKSQGISVGPGRGSVGGSLVAYVLGITELDPLKYNLLFERFLNPSRISMPDIDMDFADNRRDDVIEYVRQKYGKDHVAQISTFGTMAARQAVKDVGRAMGISFAEMTEVVKLIPEKPGTKLQESLDTQIDLKKLYLSNPLYKKIFDIACKTEGVVRHISVHACAVVIADEPLTEYSALQRPPTDKDTTITQLSAKPLESLGLLKMDFLGLRNLTIIQKTLNILRRTQKDIVDIATISLKDKKTFDLFSRGDTTGVFQFESPGMKRYLRNLKPSQFEDIIAMVALYRPGPMEWIPDYIAYKHGKKKVKYPHADLEGILDSTYGIAIYQEQILQIVQKFAGFSLGEADLLRRAIGKKILKELMAQKEKFIEKAIVKGHTKEQATFIYERVIEPFAEYGFNKSHAACYALVSYQTAYLKAHYPTEFMAALLSCDAQDMDRVAIDVEECQRLGIKVLPPSLNESLSNFTVVGSKEIRFGLKAIKGLGESTVESILLQREKEGIFQNLIEFSKRMPSDALNKKSLEALIYSGAMDQFDNRKTLIHNGETIIDYAKNIQEKQKAGQHSLFGGLEENAEGLVLKNMVEETYIERLQWEKQYLGLYISGHPLDGLKKYFKKKATLIENLTPKDVGKTNIVMGLVSGIRKIYTKNKEAMLSFSLEDPTGSMDVIIFPKVYKTVLVPIEEDMLLLLSGRVDRRNEEFQLSCHEVKKLDINTIIEKAKAEKFYDPKIKVVREQIVDMWEEDQEGMEVALEQKSETVAVVEDPQLFIEKEITQDYIIEVPAMFTKTDLLQLQKVLEDHQGGDQFVYLSIQGKKIKTKLKIKTSPGLEQKVSSVLKK